MRHALHNLPAVLYNGSTCPRPNRIVVAVVEHTRTLPAKFTSVKLQVFRAPIAPVSEEQLWKLASSLSAYTQANRLPNGIQLTNPQLQRTLVYDLVQLNIQENSVRDVLETINTISATLDAVHEIVPLQPPFPAIGIFEATMGAVGGTSSQRIMELLGPVGERLVTLGDNYVGPGIRFLFNKGLDLIDLRLEPFFSDVRSYFVAATFNRTQAPLPELGQLREYLSSCFSIMQRAVMPEIQSIIDGV